MPENVVTFYFNIVGGALDINMASSIEVQASV
jgi:hypothetical protein